MPKGMSLPNGVGVTVYLGYIHRSYLDCQHQQRNTHDCKQWKPLLTVANVIEDGKNKEQQKQGGEQ